MDNRMILLPVPLEDFMRTIQELIGAELKKQKDSEREEKLLSPAEVCKLFQPNISKVTLSKWTSNGHLKSYRIGGRLFYKCTEVIDSLSTLKKYKRLSAA